MKKYKGFISKEAYLQYLLQERKVLSENGNTMAILEINEEIANVADKIKVDYYSLA